MKFVHVDAVQFKASEWRRCNISLVGDKGNRNSSKTTWNHEADVQQKNTWNLEADVLQKKITRNLEADVLHILDHH